MPKSEQAGNPPLGSVGRPGRIVSAILLAAAALACPPAAAQSAKEPTVAIVDGLAPGDFLNVRGTPSPIGSIQARLPNGAGVTNFGCVPYDGHDWCKVTTLDAPKVTGWTPGRYLRATGDEAAAPNGAATASTSRPASNRPAPALPDNFDARIEGGANADQADNEKLREALVARYSPVYRAALGLPAAGQAGSAAAAPAPGAPADDTPHPTPRPNRPGEALASVQPAEKATGEVPCASVFGQPVQACKASSTRLGPGVADIAISLPDGGSRTIRFRAGKPDGSDSSEPMHFTREGSLNMIRIGKAERFEILDALALGN